MQQNVKKDTKTGATSYTFLNRVVVSKCDHMTGVQKPDELA